MTDDDIDGLVAHYTFDEDRPPFVRDSVGQMHGRAMSEPQWIEGVHGKSIAFDGKDDGVLFPNYNFGQEFTIVVWAKPAGAANGSEALVSNKLAQGRLPGWALQLHAGKPERLFFGMSNGIMSHRAAVTTAHTISRNRWNHFATTADAKGGRSRLFVDGFDHTEKANGRPNTPVVGPWTIGRKRDDPTQPGVFHPYHGALDDLRIYNRLLSADEIKRLYEATRP